MILDIFLIILALISSLIVLSLFHFLLTGNSPSVTSPATSRKMIIQKISLDENSVFYDLGCGNANLLKELSRVFPRASFVGIENSPISFLSSKILVLLGGFKNIEIKYGNFFNQDLSFATHIYLWIFVKDMDKLHKKFKSELKPGTLVYSLDFPFTNVNPDKVIDLGKDKKFGHTLYVYSY